MANIQNINGASKIQDTYQIIYNNDSALNAEGIATAQALIDHIADLIAAHESGAISFSSTDPNLTKNNVKEQLEQISARISNIIASSGTSSTEVVDARLSSVYGAFATIATRLNYSDGKLKSVEDQIGTQPIGTLPLTPTTSIQSVTDSYDGIIDAEIGGATLYQAVTNGDFANGQAPWNFRGNHATSHIVNNQLNLIATGNGDTGGAGDVFQQVIPGGLTISSKFALKIRFKNNGGNNCILNFDWAANRFTTLISDTLNDWQEITFVGYPANISRYLHIFCSNITVEANVLIEYVMLFNSLTGTPYENYTADQMNALVNKYGEGLVSTNELSILSRGRNLFDKLNATPDKYLNEMGNWVNSVGNSGESDYIRTKENTIYTKNGLACIATFWTKNKTFISSVVGTQWTTPLGIAYTRISTPPNEWDTLMLNEGSTALPYEPYKNSILSTTCMDKTKFSLSKLPNLVQNEVNQASGYISAVKRVSGEYVLKSTDVTFIGNGTNVQFVWIEKPLDYIGRSMTDNKNDSAFQHSIFSTKNFVTLDLAENINTISGRIYSNSFALAVPLGTYANLTSAQNALAGTKIQYQLATPVFIPYEDFDQYGIVCDGALASHSGYTNVSYEADIVPNAALQYPRNIGSSVDGISQSLANTISQVTVHEQRLDDVINDKASSIPTTGTWLKGDKVWNDSPDAGEYIGWVCVVAGTPGTWKGFGIIQV